MAACTLAVGTADTGATPNDSAAFTPALNDLLVVLAIATGTVDASPTCTSSIGGFTFSFAGLTTWSGGTQSLYAFVSDALVSNTASQTVTVDCPSDPATGTVIYVWRISGMSKTGTTAIRQLSATFGVAAAARTVSLTASCLTGNPTIGCLGGSSAPTNITPPTNWTEPASADLSFSAPNCTFETCFRDSGFTSISSTWTMSASTAWGAMMLELDSSVTVNNFRVAWMVGTNVLIAQTIKA